MLSLRLALGGLLLLILTYLAAAEWLSRPAPGTVGAAPPDLGAQTLRWPTPGGGHIAGWFAPGQPGHGAVLLLHGRRGDRRQMLARQRFLQRAGYATLAIDLPGHGESTGDRLGFGAHEALGVQAALAYLRQALPGERLGLIAVSLGAAATVLAQPAVVLDALVLESMYASIEHATRDRLALRLGPAEEFAPLLAAPLLWQLPWRTGVAVQDLRPLAAMPRLRAPVLVAAGALDRHTQWSDTEALFAAAPMPKALWRVDGAAHVDLHAFAPRAYEVRVGAFLAQHLRPGR